MSDQIQKHPVQFVWLIDGRREISDVVVKKIIKIVAAYSAKLSIVYDNRLRAKERNYWFDDKVFETISNDWVAAQQHKINVVKSLLTDAKVNHRIDVVEHTEFEKTLTNCFKQAKNNVLVLQNEALGSRHPIFQALASLPCSILLLRDSRWRKELKFLGAVDPLHENSRPMDLDLKIVEQTKKLAQVFNANWFIGHACYVQPSFLQYKKKFEDIHREGLQEFLDQVKIPRLHGVLLKGMPEDAITDWMVEQKADLLVMGIVARNKLISHLVGSTTMPLLNNPPSDMLLVKSDNKLSA